MFCGRQPRINRFDALQIVTHSPQHADGITLFLGLDVEARFLPYLKKFGVVMFLLTQGPSPLAIVLWLKKDLKKRNTLAHGTKRSSRMPFLPRWAILP